MLGHKKKSLTLAECVDYIAKVRYKNWFLVPNLAESIMVGMAMEGRGVKGSEDVFMVDLMYTAPDSRKPGETTQIEGRITIIPSAFEDIGQLQGYVLANIVRMEAHEAREYFLVADERPFDPHTDEGNHEWSIRQPTLCAIATADGSDATEEDPLVLFKNPDYLKPAA